jgi:UDP-4-amino-4-deoxy-L-arabinose-oxoglutarate aminotransferase
MTPRSEFLPFGRPDFSAEEIEAVARVMRSGWIGLGPETLAFEADLAAALGAPHVVAVSSCTAALFLSLVVAGVGPGDEVVVPSLTWCSTANAALYAGAVPVFCDVDPRTFSATPETIAAQVTDRTRAVVPVHFGGLAVDVRDLRSRLDRRIAVVEDAAHAFGALLPGGGAVGASGQPTCFSFYANKNLSTGEGGAVALFDHASAERLRSLRQHGLPVNAWHRYQRPSQVLRAEPLREIGYKANYTDLQAAIGRVQLRRQAEFDARRRALAGRYLERIAEARLPLVAQSGLADEGHARHLFCVRVASSSRLTRDELLQRLRAANIGATIHYALLHPMPLYAPSRRGPLPVTEALGETILTLPISASMTVADADDVCDRLTEAYS